jgi:radical SAM protein with 4Fe4S-binding SPASM domain
MLDRNRVALNLTETYNTVQNIKERNGCVVHIADAKHLIEADYFGVVSGNQEKDKFEKSGLSYTKSELVDAPIINELPIALECEFIEYQSDDTGLGVIGKVVRTSVEEANLKDDKVDIDSWRVINLEPIGRALEYPDLMLTKEDYRRLFAFIYQKRMERMPVTYGCSHFLGLDLERELRGWYFFCGAGIHVASIMCNGDIGACLDIERRPETIQGNIFRDSFTDVWKNRFKIFRRPMSDFNEKCRVCPEAKW